MYFAISFILFTNIVYIKYRNCNFFTGVPVVFSLPDLDQNHLAFIKIYFLSSEIQGLNDQTFNWIE